jgi:uncharacterized membrane protein YdbT with pleckstrin-like domain
MKKEKQKTKKRNENKKGTLISALIGGAIGGFMGAFAAIYQPDAGVSQLIINLSVIMVFYYIAIVIQVIIHESGHLVCGLLSGYRFLSFRIFNLVIAKENGRLKLKK